MYFCENKVIERGDKYLEKRINDKNVIVSIDRLLPAFIINDDNEHDTDEPSTKPPNITAYAENQRSVIPKTSEALYWKRSERKTRENVM
jgi:hypothetical protein